MCPVAFLVRFFGWARPPLFTNAFAKFFGPDERYWRGLAADAAIGHNDGGHGGGKPHAGAWKEAPPHWILVGFWACFAGGLPPMGQRRNGGAQVEGCSDRLPICCRVAADTLRADCLHVVIQWSRHSRVGSTHDSSRARRCRPATNHVFSHRTDALSTESAGHTFSCNTSAPYVQRHS